jgi:hypothetical protein
VLKLFAKVVKVQSTSNSSYDRIKTSLTDLDYCRFSSTNQNWPEFSERASSQLVSSCIRLSHFGGKHFSAYVVRVNVRGDYIPDVLNVNGVANIVRVTGRYGD